MRPVTITVEVARPAADVFAFLSDYENNPKFMGGIVSATWTTRDEAYDQVATMLGRRIVSSFRLVERTPPTRLKVTSTSGPFPITETRAIEPIGDDRSRVTVTVEGDPTGFFGRLLSPLMPVLVRRSVQRDYERLKGLLE